MRKGSLFFISEEGITELSRHTYAAATQNATLDLVDESGAASVSLQGISRAVPTFIVRPRRPTDV